MHPRMEARVAAVAERHRTIVLEQLDAAIGQLRTVSGLRCIDQLVAHYRTIRVHLAEDKMSPHEMMQLEAQVTTEFTLLHSKILKPLFEELLKIDSK